MPVPVQISLPLAEESHGGVAYQILGELVPVLQVEMTSSHIYFEHHVLLWKDPNVEIGLKTLDGAFKRIISGMPVLMTEARGPGRIAFSRDGAGQVFAMHLHPGESVDVREHQFLAATDSVHYNFKRVKGIGNMLFSGTGFFMDTFSCPHQDGVLWLHGYGNVFQIELKHGESIDVEPGGWIYKDHNVGMETIFQKFSSGLFGSAGQIFWNRFTGPGKVGIQSMYYYLPTTE